MESSVDTVTVNDGDRIVVSGPPPDAPRIGRDENPAKPRYAPADVPGKRVPLKFGNASFDVELTWRDVIRSATTVYGLEGPAGIRRLLTDSGMEDRARPIGKGGKERIDPEEFLTGDRLTVFQLLRAADAAIGTLADTSNHTLTPLAQAVAFDRLKRAREEVEAETRRYFAIRQDTATVRRVLDAGAFSSTAYALNSGSPDVERSLNALTHCRVLADKAGLARRRANDTYGRLRRGTPLLISPRTPIAVAAPLINQAIDSELRKAHPEIAAIESSAADAEKATKEAVVGAAGEYPIIWKVFSTRNIDHRDRLAREMLEQLIDTYGANGRISESLAEEPSRVWKYPCVLHDALERYRVPRLSVAWAAADLRLEAETGLRLMQTLSIFSGLATLGLVGAAAALGSAAIAPPVALLLIAADIVFNLVNAVQEFTAFRLQSAAFNACLDPSLSLAAEPSLVATVVEISMSLLSVAP